MSHRRLAAVAQHLHVAAQPAAQYHSDSGLAAFRLDGRVAFITGGARCERASSYAA